MRSRLVAVLSAAIILAGASLSADSAGDFHHDRFKMLGKRNPFLVDDLPPGRTRARLKSLPGKARTRAMKWLHRFDFPENDLGSMVIDGQGGVLYVEPAPDLAATEKSDPVDGGAELPASAPAAEQAFSLHSRPGSPNTLFLDFDGHSFTATAWSSGTVDARAFDLDGNTAEFDDTERRVIAEVWHRVSEDFAAFDIDVTTEEPAAFGPYTGRVLITSKTDVHGAPMPYSSGGGVAYVNVWGGSNYASYYSPALVFYDNLASSANYIAEASAHEFGHNLGLSHDGTSSVTYYSGHGAGETSWAPIMGASYYKNVTQWSKGEYPGANNTQNDIDIISSKLYFADDDHGDTLGDATPLEIESDGTVLVSNPETDPDEVFPSNKGVIEASSDQDVFYFSTSAGPVEFTVNPAWDAFYRSSKRGSNLDVRLSLLDAGGSVLSSSDPETDTYASIATDLPAGDYYLIVTGIGNGNYSDYASTGQYYISGSVAAGSANQAPVANFGFGCTGLDCSFVDASSDSDGTLVSWSWDFGDGGVSNQQHPNHDYDTAGTYSVSLTVTDDAGASRSKTRSVSVSAPNSTPTAGFTASCSDLSCSFVDDSNDSDGTLAAWAWDFGDGDVSNLQHPNHDYAVAGTYSVSLTVTDDQGASDVYTSNLTVSAASTEIEVVVDNQDAEVEKTGTWTVSSGPDPWAGQSLYNNADSVFRWLPVIPESGRYQVYAWWTYHKNRSTEVPYRIIHATGTDTVTVNQKDLAKGGRWNLLGEYDLSAGVGVVEVSSENGQASADAVRLVRIGDDNPVSNLPPTAGFEFSCDVLGCSFNDSSVDSDGTLVAWAWNFGDGGVSNLQHPSHDYAAAGTYSVSLTVTDDQGASDVYTSNLTVSAASTEIEVVVDNQDAEVEKTGTWTVSSGPDPWAGQSLYNNSDSVFRWLPVVPESGRYQVYAWWTYHRNRSTEVPYRIDHASGTDTVTVNQKDVSTGGRWNLLGEYDLSAGVGVVEVSSENGQASADAIRLVKLP